MRGDAYKLLLGRPWQRQVRLCKVEHDNGDVAVTLRDPSNHAVQGTFLTTPRIARKSKSSFALTVAAVEELWRKIKIADGDSVQVLSASGRDTTHVTSRDAPTLTPPVPTALDDALLRANYEWDPVRHVLAAWKYKPVDKKVHPIPGTMPDDARIIRNIPEDPLLTLPPVTAHPPDFQPGVRLTQERMDDLGLFSNDFLWPEEQKFLAHILVLNEMAFAWDESEKGRFRDDYFPPVVIPTIPHTPWAHRQPPVPPGIRDEIIKLIQDKIAAGVYEPSNSSYQSRWFAIPKKVGHRIIHDLQPLNAVTIKDAAGFIYVEFYAEQCAGRAIYTLGDLFVGFDHQLLAERSRDLTTFQTPLGAMRLTRLPMGWTNSPAIFQAHVAWILKDEAEIAPNFQDDINVLGPRTRYELPEGGYETIPENTGIRRFVFEHGVDLNRVLHRLKCAGATISGKKFWMGVPEVVAVGQLCTYEGRLPDRSKVAKILDWPVCEDRSEVRGFLGTCGTVRNWVENFAAKSRPLVNLTKKDVPFVWEAPEQQSMDTLKHEVANSPAIRPIDYKSGLEVIVAVDSSYIAVGYILLQLDAEGRRRPARFGSIAWNERESRYSQAKLELYGLYRALKSVRIYIIGVMNLVVEVDAKYIKGMLNNPDIQPNNAINRWIEGILLFDFTLRHVPGKEHSGPDGLSRRRKGEDSDDEEDSSDEDEDEDGDTLLEDVVSCGFWLGKAVEDGMVDFEGKEGRQLVLAITTMEEGEDDMVEIPADAASRNADASLRATQTFLETLQRPTGLDDKALHKFLKNASHYFVRGGRLWRKDPAGRHQLVLFGRDRLQALRQAHNDLGHTGIYDTRRKIADRFWWPFLQRDVAWFVQTCHSCQTRSVEKVVLPPSISVPAPLFRKAFADTMHMPSVNGFHYIVQARCSLIAWPEWRALRKENGEAIGKFIFEELLCRWGGLEEIVTDNGTAFVAGVDWLAKKYGIRHIRISAYNSQANGIAERSHRTIRDSLVKICKGDITQWLHYAPHVFWADRVTTRRSTGHSPYYMAHGVEPLLPFDLTEATFLIPDISGKLSTEELIAMRARQLMKRDDDLAAIHDRITHARLRSVADFERRYANTLHDYNFKPGALVLVLNKKIEAIANQKCRPRYFGPMLVVSRSRGGSYRLAELDGTLSKLKFAAFRLIPYHPRSKTTFEVTEFVDPADLAGVAEEDAAAVEVEL